MQQIFYYLLIFTCLTWSSTYALKNYLNNPIYDCVKCLCHARTGCFRRINCASYSIDQTYWKQAGSLSVDDNDDPDNEETFKKCMKNENCIVGTIVEYTNAIGEIDCNCDQEFDCKDRFAIHLFGENCLSPNFTKTYADRFNQCRGSINVDEMLPFEGGDQCTPESVR